MACWPRNPRRLFRAAFSASRFPRWDFFLDLTAAQSPPDTPSENVQAYIGSLLGPALVCHAALPRIAPWFRFPHVESFGMITPHEKRTIQLTSVAACRKTPWRISQPQKMRQRKRLRSVDRVVDTVSAALQRNGQNTKAVDRWYNEMPREEEMLPKDKYTIFDKKEKKYRKGIHSECFCRLLLQLC